LQSTGKILLKFDLIIWGIPKANFSWGSNLSKIWQLIASLSEIQLQLNLTNLKLEYLKSSFKCKKDINAVDIKFFVSLEIDFF